jgi:hypothetical protein
MKWSGQKENNKSDEANCRLVWSFTIAQISAQKQLFGMRLEKKTIGAPIRHSHPRVSKKLKY